MVKTSMGANIHYFFPNFIRCPRQDSKAKN